VAGWTVEVNVTKVCSYMQASLLGIHKEEQNSKGHSDKGNRAPTLPHTLAMHKHTDNRTSLSKSESTWSTSSTTSRSDSLRSPISAGNASISLLVMRSAPATVAARMA